MQSLHELEKRAEVHRVEALKKIEALSEPSVDEQEPRPEIPVADDGLTEPAVPRIGASRQH
jgi:hypothetical protein